MTRNCTYNKIILLHKINFYCVTSYILFIAIVYECHDIDSIFNSEIFSHIY